MPVSAFQVLRAPPKKGRSGGIYTAEERCKKNSYNLKDWLKKRHKNITRVIKKQSQEATTHAEKISLPMGLSKNYKKHLTFKKEGCSRYRSFNFYMLKSTTKGLIFKILLALILGAIIGRVLILNEFGIMALRGFVTVSDIISQFLSFFVPIAVLTLVMPGIIELGSKASKMLIAGISLSFVSFVIIGFVCIIAGYTLIPNILDVKEGAQIHDIIDFAGFLPPILTPFFDVVTAMIIAFSFGIAATKVESPSLMKVLKEVEACTYTILNRFLIPILPFYIFCILVKLSASGELFMNLGNFAVVLLLIFVISNGYTLFMMFVMSKISGRSFLFVVKSYLPAYLTAFGTRSSKATIPVSLACAEKIGISKEIREFGTPLLATTHMLGDMAMQIFGAIAFFYIFTGEMIPLTLIISYVFLLSSILIAAPGTPGGVVVTTRPFLTSFLGFPTGVAEIFFAVGIANDSFATGTNVLGDGVIVMILEKINKKLTQKNPTTKGEEKHKAEG